MCVSEMEIFRATAPFCMLNHTRHTETEEIGREILCLLHTWRCKYPALWPQSAREERVQASGSLPTGRLHYPNWIDDSTKELKLARQENSKRGEKAVEIVPDPLVLSHSISLLMTGAELEMFNVGVRLFHIQGAWSWARFFVFFLLKCF